MKVWIVTTGEYSSYSVHSVWDNESDAETFAARLPDGNVSEDEPISFEIRSGLPERIVIEERRQYLYSDGKGPTYHEPYNTQITSVATWAGERPQDEVPVRTRRHIGPSGMHGSYTTIYIEVFGVDKERVDKVFTEIVARTRAEFDLLVAKADVAGFMLFEDS